MTTRSSRRFRGSALVFTAFLGLGSAAAWAQGTTTTEPPVQTPQPQPATVDLNTATQAQLEALPGVLPAQARQIIAGRPYSSVDDLARTGLTPEAIEAIRPLVRVGALGEAAGATGRAAQKTAEGVSKGAEAGAEGVAKGTSGAATGIEKGANAGARGIEKGASATKKGVQKGIEGGAKGVEKGAGAVARGAKKVQNKVSGKEEAKVPPTPGMVWVNTETGIFYVHGSSHYGRGDGEFQNEADAIKAGYHRVKAAVTPKK